MIPTFHCAQYLGETLASLLDQSLGALDEAQILVVDDCSTRDDPAEVVARLGRGRIGFHRHARNLGVCENFNSCFDLAERQWVQILHGDDYMLPDAYEEFAACLEEFPHALALFARSQIVTSTGNLLFCSEALGPEERGRLEYDPRRWGRNLIYPAGVLIHRRALETVGRFDCAFAHVNDWNYWWRLARTNECVYTRACTAGYRASAESHSASLVRSARNVTEGLEQLERLIDSLPDRGANGQVDIPALYEGVYEIAYHQCVRFVREREPFGANWRTLWRMPRRLLWSNRKALAALWLRHCKQMLSRR